MRERYTIHSCAEKKDLENKINQWFSLFFFSRYFKKINIIDLLLVEHTLHIIEIFNKITIIMN